MAEKLEVSSYCGKNFSNVRMIEGQVTDQSLTLNSEEIQEPLDGTQMGFAGNRRRRNLGLRENPKKSKRGFSISKQDCSICEQCGRRFKSNKALFGHMRLHRKRKGVDVKKILEMPNPTKKKRSERRYKINSCSNNSSLSNLNPAASSSSVSCDSIDEELEDIAVCLLMLGNGGCCSLYAGQIFSDDDDSVKMDNNFPDVSAQTETLNSCELEYGYAYCGDNQGFSMSIQENPNPSFDCLKKTIIDVQTENQAEFNDMGCGYGSFKEEFAEYCVFTQEFSTQENPPLGSSYDCLNKSASIVGTENQADLNDTEMKEQTNGATIDRLKKLGFDLTTQNQAELYEVEIRDGAKNTIIEGTPLKHKKYTCKICNKIFKSGQSLGGHKLHCPISRRYKLGFETRTEAEILISDQKAGFEASGSENQVGELGGNEKKKRGRKHHKCPACLKSFGSGQALGGHMRAHFYGKFGSDEKVIDGVDHVTGPEISPTVCGSNQQMLEISGNISGAVLVGVVAGV